MPNHFGPMLASLLQFLRFADRRIARRCVKLEMMLKFFKDYMSAVP